jgi:LuxR family maltose regulon positive regulatory protein
MSRATAGGATGARRRTPREPDQRRAIGHPVPSQLIVRRPRLHERLRAGSEGPLTLVSAPAGTGKTVLVSSWVARGESPHPVAWVSVEDVGPGAAPVWPLIVEGLGRIGVEVPRRVPPTDAAMGDHSFLDSMASAITAAGPTMLVLDCDGSLPAEAAKGLHHLLVRSNGCLHLVLLSRVDPMLPLHRYRLANTLVEIRMADLAFTKDEARQLLGGMEIDLSPSLIDSLTERTRGWAAGLRFAAMSLAHRTDREAAVREFTGDTGTVAEYLLAEVLDAQPDGARELLLHTSVVDVVRPGLAEVLAGPRAPRAVAFLARGNAFLEELPDSPGTYRYHALFRELLRAQLGYEAPAKFSQLHRAAAAWMATHGMLLEAVHHAVKAGAWGDAATHVLDDLAIVQLLVEHPPGRLHDLLTQLPSDAEGVDVSLIRAALAIVHLDMAGCSQHIAEAQEMLKREKSPHRPAVDLTMVVLLLAQARAVGDGEAAGRAAEDVERLLRLQLPERVAAHPELVALAQSSKGQALVSRGELDAAAEAFAVGSATEVSRGREYPLLSCWGHLALIAAMAGQLRKAASLSERASRIHTEAGLPPNRRPAASEVALAWVDTETYDLAAARRHVIRAIESQDDNDPLTRVMLTLVRARLCRARGDLDGALTVLTEARAKGPDLPPWLQDSLRMEEAALDIVNGDPSLAARVVEGMGEPASPAAALVVAQANLASGILAESLVTSLNGRSAPLNTRVGGWLLEASQQLMIGDEVRAARALERSLRLAAPERLRRPFREAPPDVRRLLRLDSDLAARHSWLGDGQRAGSGTMPATSRSPRPRGTGRAPEGKQASLYILEPLTAKEQEVLGHLAELLTTDEIAGVMFVSVNTVRTHVRNILRKLASSRRNEAVRRARELNLVPRRVG